jgi:hypothetical protein
MSCLFKHVISHAQNKYESDYDPRYMGYSVHSASWMRLERTDGLISRQFIVKLSFMT